jgi:hypothetical protein
MRPCNPRDSRDPLFPVPRNLYLSFTKLIQTFVSVLSHAGNVYTGEWRRSPGVIGGGGTAYV